MHRWLEAAFKYGADRTKHDGDGRRVAVSQAAVNLVKFMESSEWEPARELLRASQQFVRFAEEEQSGSTVCWLLTGTGFSISSERSGSAAAYRSEGAQQPKLRPGTPQEIAEAWMKEEIKDPETLLVWIRQQLDAIADKAP